MISLGSSGKSPALIPRHGQPAMWQRGSAWNTLLAPIHIAMIDNFNPLPPEEAENPQDIHFNHGETVANMLRSGGADPHLQDRIVLQPYNVGAPDGQEAEQTDRWTARIATVLARIIDEVRRDGHAVDVVCMALQNHQDTPQTAIVRHHIETLLALGVPVVVAAGNRYDDSANPINLAPNALASPHAFIVQGTQHGNLLRYSKPGNISAEGRSTSFAVPAVAPLLGDYKTQGCTLDEIRSLIEQRVAFHHGTLPAAIGQNAYSTKPTVTITEATAPDPSCPDPVLVSALF